MHKGQQGWPKKGPMGSSTKDMWAGGGSTWITLIFPAESPLLTFQTPLSAGARAQSRTKYSCDHETTARNACTVKNSSEHINMTMSAAGLTIHPDFPHYGANPSGLANMTVAVGE